MKQVELSEMPKGDIEIDFLQQVDLSPSPKIQGVHIGTLLCIDAGTPVVSVPGFSYPKAAQTSVKLDAEDVGASLAISFIQGAPGAPLILGKIYQLQATPRIVKNTPEQLIIEAQKEIVLKCGKASISLTPQGKVVIRGTHIVSRSSGANKVKGASVQIN